MSAFLSNAEFIVEHYRDYLGVEISKEFIACASRKLGEDFERKTGIKATNPKVISFVTDKDDYRYEKGIVSRVKQRLYVNHNWNDVSWSWYTKSGRIVDMADTDIDCDDLVITFDHLDPLLIQKQMYPKEELPFRLKDLSYELKIERLNQEMTIEATVRADGGADVETLLNEARTFVGNFNDKLLKKNISGVHQFEPRIENEKIVFDIDTGATGAVFLKQFLQFLSDHGKYTEVRVL